MKRSESVLIYGVTAVLAVILAVAIIFGGPESNTPNDSSDLVAKSGAGALNENALDELVPGTEVDANGGTTTTKVEGSAPFDILDAVLDGETPSMDGGAIGIDDGGFERVTDQESLEGLAAGEGLMVPLRSVPEVTIADLGTQRTIENEYSGQRFRIVTVERGDTLDGLLQRWCPGTDRATVAALNETVDLDLLRYNTELCLPWYDDALLVEAYVERKQRSSDRAPAAAAANVASGGAAPGAAGAGEEHVIGEGESLWTIAVAKVGAKKANAYIGKVLDLNPGIVDASRVRAGRTIRLPR